VTWGSSSASCAPGITERRREERLVLAFNLTLALGDLAGGNWRNAGFTQNDNHPVVNVSWYDASPWPMAVRRARHLHCPARRNGVAAEARNRPSVWGTAQGSVRYANAAMPPEAAVPEQHHHSCDDGYSDVTGTGMARARTASTICWERVGMVRRRLSQEPTVSMSENPLYGGPGSGGVSRRQLERSPKDVRCGNRYYSPPRCYQNLGFRLMRWNDGPPRRY